MLLEIYYIFVVFISTAQHTMFANVPNYRSFADRLVDSLEATHVSPPHVVLCWDESHSLIEPVPNEAWTIFSELQHALRTIRELSIISVFLSMAGKFHSFSPSPESDPSMHLMT